MLPRLVGGEDQRGVLGQRHPIFSGIILSVEFRMPAAEKSRKLRPPQAQRRPGQEKKMRPVPETDPAPHPEGKLAGKVALITGGDSGIGHAVAVLFAQEGARVALAYLNEHEDAKATQSQISKYGESLILPGDISSEKHCQSVVSTTIRKFGRLDIIVNNAAVQYEQKELGDISSRQLIKTFETNFFPYFWVTKAALPHLKHGASIINTASVTAYRGSDHLIDYASTKGAIVSFTRSLAMNLVKKGIRVNGVAPGPIWTPLIVSSFKPTHTAKFGSTVPMERAGEPAEVAPCYLFLASDDSSYMTGQFLHPNGGEIING